MNYNSLMNKPTINYRELIGDNTVTEVGGITEEQFNTLLTTDLSSYYTKAQIDNLFSRSYVYREKSGSIVTFDCPSTSQSIPELTSEIVAVQSGTGDPSPTNVRPISGWSAVNVYDTGVNIWDEEWEVGGINVVTGQNENATDIIRCKNHISVKSNTTYHIVGLSKVYCLFLYDKNKNYITSVNVANIQGANYTIRNDCYYIRFRCFAAYGTTYNNDISINYPSTDTSYHAYSGTTYTTTLKDGQGNPLTCYGGKLSNVNGVQTLTVTHGYIASYNGETLPSTWISDRDVYAEGTTPTIGAQVVYPLTTPTEITQDSLTIASVGGTNNIWSDSGDITVKALDRIIQG